jgi:hypothetical protein
VTEAFREEGLNVVLAKLVKERGSLTVPERIRRFAAGQGLHRSMPDVTITDYHGMLIIIEGRSGEGGNAEASLTNDARCLVLECKTSICIAVHCPSSI